jgi:hypothetical protein
MYCFRFLFLDDGLSFETSQIDGIISATLVKGIPKYSPFHHGWAPKDNKPENLLTNLLVPLYRLCVTPFFCETIGTAATPGQLCQGL